jgi:uncharacterized membrane protein (DUF485 family)
LISCDGIFLPIYIGYIHVAAYPYGVLGVFIADIDNGISKSMSIRIIIICWSVCWDDNEGSIFAALNSSVYNLTVF